MFHVKCQAVCETDRLALERAACGTETPSLDKMPCFQAVERIAATKPMCPGQVERREYAYARRP